MRLANEGIFVDESGDFGLTSRSKRFATVGFVYSKNPSLLRKKLRRLLKRYHFKNKYPRHLSELKFMLPYSELIQRDYSVEDLNNIYNPQMPKLRSEALTIIRDHVDGVYAAILDKPSRTSSTWTTETIGNFVFVETFYVNILNQLRLPNPPLFITIRADFRSPKWLTLQLILPPKIDGLSIKITKCTKAEFPLH